ncbi:hypothetical protein AMECASPLE_001566 [Ameca splendens]|uniref:Secreted protein n=1 Tax=Ameca splendens TaxID=208324 RepID=A0ABV0XYC5_9TELE
MPNFRGAIFILAVLQIVEKQTRFRYPPAGQFELDASPLCESPTIALTNHRWRGPQSRLSRRCRGEFPLQRSSVKAWLFKFLPSDLNGASTTNTNVIVTKSPADRAGPGQARPGHTRRASYLSTTVSWERAEPCYNLPLKLQRDSCVALGI